MNRRTLVLAAVTAVALVGCSSVDTQPDEMAVQYNDGIFIPTDREFIDCKGPSVQDYDGPGNDHYIYPAGQRTYQFTGAEGSDGAPVTVVSRDNQQLVVRGVLTFELNDECDVLRQFHEQIGIKFRAYEGDGWTRMLDTYVRQPLERSLDSAAQQYGWRSLYNDPAIKGAFEREVLESVPEIVKQTAGGDFFSDFRVTVQKPDAPEELVAALAAEEKAVAENNAQKKRNETIRTELQTIRELVAVLGPEGYVAYKALEDGRVTVLPVPQGTSVQIAPPSQSGPLE